MKKKDNWNKYFRLLAGLLILLAFLPYHFERKTISAYEHPTKPELSFTATYKERYHAVLWSWSYTNDDLDKISWDLDIPNMNFWVIRGLDLEAYIPSLEVNFGEERYPDLGITVVLYAPYERHPTYWELHSVVRWSSVKGWNYDYE